MRQPEGFLSEGQEHFSVSSVARFCSRPTKEHWTAVKQIFRYLKLTMVWCTQRMKMKAP